MAAICLMPLTAGVAAEAAVDVVADTEGVVTAAVGAAIGAVAPFTGSMVVNP